MRLPSNSVPIDVIGFAIDKAPENLFNRVANNEIKIESVVSPSRFQIWLKVTSDM